MDTDLWMEIRGFLTDYNILYNCPVIVNKTIFVLHHLHKIIPFNYMQTDWEIVYMWLIINYDLAQLEQIEQSAFCESQEVNPPSLFMI